MTLHHGDCLDILPTIPDGSVDAIIADPPYGTTACKWDSVIPFEPMWRELRRVIKPNGAIVIFGSEPFSSALRMSNIREYKYDWVWEKTLFTNFASVKKRPANRHENVIIFYSKQPTYNPQMQAGKAYSDSVRGRTMGVTGNAVPLKNAITNKGTRYPSSVQRFSNGNNGNVHPTQKPVALLEYLIRTYTDEGETVLDFTMGSGTTGVAAVNTGREFIGIELDESYYNIARERIANTERPLL